MIMPTEYERKRIRFCEKCGNQISKSKWTSWSQYSKRKYCGRNCLNSTSRVRGRDDVSISQYIGQNSRNGRLMADFNLGVLKAVEKVVDVDDKVDGEDLGNGRKKDVICMYKGVPVTADVVKTANQWLMENWVGKAGQRLQEPEIDTRTDEEVLKELEYILNELGYEMVKKLG